MPASDRDLAAHSAERPLSCGTISRPIRAIVELGRALGLEMVAEGIEGAEQAQWFRSLGCQYGQGFHFAEPLSADAADAYLADHLELDADITRLDAGRRGKRAAG